MSFRREKGVPRGGPDGGSGGEGGSIYLVSDQNLHSLVYFRFHPLNKAKRGAHGEGGNRQGKKGADLILRVPVGTIVREKDKEEILFDFTAPNQTFLAARGGRAGRGNAVFASSTNRAPRRWEEGLPGEERELILELKLIADVGLVGFPNAGKSTLIAKISAAKPLIADYPFTTLVPNLGVVDVDEFRSFVIADVPGLIEGAHRGQGLGLRFLKHVERTKVLAHMVDVSPYTQRDPVEDYKTVCRELEFFNPALLERRQVLVANKIDLLDKEEHRLEKIRALASERKIPFFAVSSLQGTGVKKLVAGLGRALGFAETC